MLVFLHMGFFVHYLVVYLPAYRIMNKLITLDTLQEQESAIIVRVGGEGAFRHRIVEMGFVAGTKVTSLKKAPLQNPVDYAIMGYNVSLRQEEAELIEVLSEEAYKQLNTNDPKQSVNTSPIEKVSFDDFEPTHIKDQSKRIKVALVGNPNSGKTTLFNYASHSRERVGNYSGVTVGAKTARFKQQAFTFDIVDLPGTYSVTHYSPEERYVQDFLINEHPDVVVNVIDASNLERNLYLTTQLIDMGVKVVIALNMYDELEKRGDVFDFQHLGEMIGMPMVPTVASKGLGIHDLFATVIEVAKGKHPYLRLVNINYGTEIEQSIDSLKNVLSLGRVKLSLPSTVSKRSIALMSLEGNTDVLPQTVQVTLSAKAEEERNRLYKCMAQPSETAIADARYAFIKGALHQCLQLAEGSQQPHLNVIDKVLLNKFLSLPIFLFFIWLMFWATFTVGAYPMDWIDMGVGALGSLIEHNMANGMLKDMLVDGVIGGVGGVIIFLPNILILFLFISIMEDTGYMARVAFVMDRIMHKIGLHGGSFIPLMMGFGCNVPAIMATRTIQNRNDRLLTMLINPFMSCSARLPVYILFIGAFFPHNATTVLFSIYIIGILLAAVIALLFKKILFRSQEAPFVMELPPYRMPTLRNVLKHMWFKASQYLKKMGGVILVASIIIWSLSYFPTQYEGVQTFDNKLTEQRMLLHGTNDVEQQTEIEETILHIEQAQAAAHQEQSYLGRIGKGIEPIMQPLGFDWKMSVALLTGASAKEIVVSTLGVLYQADGSEDSPVLQERLRKATYKSGQKVGRKVFDPIVSFAFLIFVLIYFPCIATVAAIKKESGGWKWAAFLMLYTTVLAWVLAYVINVMGHLIF